MRGCCRVKTSVWCRIWTSATRETRATMADLAVRNVVAVLRGRPAITPVRQVAE